MKSEDGLGLKEITAQTTLTVVQFDEFDFKMDVTGGCSGKSNEIKYNLVALLHAVVS